MSTDPSLESASAPVDEASLRSHLKAAVAYAASSRAEARALLEAGFPGPSLVWSVRSAEMLMRYFVLAPHYMEQGLPWESAMKEGSRKLGANNWADAFKAAEEWYGPFDEPLTEEGDNAFRVWIEHVVRVRHALVHGDPIESIERAAAEIALGFADRMATWYAQRFLVSSRHPISREFREALEAATAARASADGTSELPSAPAR